MAWGGAFVTVSVALVPAATPEICTPLMSTKIIFETVKLCGELVLLRTSKFTFAKRVVAETLTAGFGLSMAKKIVIWPVVEFTLDDTKALLAETKPAQLTVPAVVWAPKRTVLTAPSGYRPNEFPSVASGLGAPCGIKIEWL